MTNQNTVKEILAELGTEVKEQLLEAYVQQEFEKKIMEVNKNCKNEASLNFKMTNIKFEFKQRLLKKVVTLNTKAAYAEVQRDEIVNALVSTPHDKAKARSSKKAAAEV